MKNAEKFNKIADLLAILYKQNDTYRKQCSTLGRAECNMVTLLNNMGRPVYMSELAKQLNVTPSRITRLVDSLVEKGYVVRSVSKQDRRKYKAEISKRGKKLNTQVNDELKQIHKEIVKALPNEKIDEVY